MGTFSFRRRTLCRVGVSAGAAPAARRRGGDEGDREDLDLDLVLDVVAAAGFLDVPAAGFFFALVVVVVARSTSSPIARPPRVLPFAPIARASTAVAAAPPNAPTVYIAHCRSDSRDATAPATACVANTAAGFINLREEGHAATGDW